ncbi:MAG TPA: KH domain-containing protein [Patescibacteria group bacterium]|nr:KH domain-containing protein [Patescibacteria group bacterium]
MNSSIDQQFVEFVVKSLVNNPDAVQVERRVDEKGVLLELTVDPEDLGRVIGKRGATAQSLRTLLRALGTKNDARYNLKIIDNGPEDFHRESAPQSTDEPAAAPTAQTDDVVDAPAPSSDAVSDDAPTTTADDMADLREDEDVVPNAPKEEDSSDRLSQTRKELEEMDDLDI